jgi:Sulfotransferase domain
MQSRVLSPFGIAHSLTSSFLLFVLVGFVRQQKNFITTVHELSESKAFFLMLDDATHHRIENPSKRTASKQIVKRTKIHSCRLYNETLTFPEAPAFIIIGAQKAGSSALADYLRLHPNIVGSIAERDKELHFLDWMIPNERQRYEKQLEMNVTEEELWCYYRQSYVKNFDADRLRRDPSLVAFEKTPSYLFLGYYLPEVLKHVCPWNPKLLAIVRNPIDRAWSQYNMAKTRNQVVSRNDRLSSMPANSTPTFEALLEKELVSLKFLRLSNAPSLNNDTEWDRSQFEIPNLTEADLKEAHKKHFRQVFLSNYLQRGMYAFQLQRWKEAFGDHLLIIKYEDLYGPKAQEVYDQVVDHIGVPRVPIPKLDGTHWSRQRYRLTLSNRTRQYLTMFFRPYNEMLDNLLDSKTETYW